MSGATTTLRDLLIAAAFSNTWLPLTDALQRGIYDEFGNRIPDPFEEY